MRRYLAVTAKRNEQRHIETCLVSSSSSGTTVSETDRVQTTGHMVYMLIGPEDVFHLPQLTVACDYAWSEGMHCGHRNSGLV
ncbi:hypothetical protein AVEN_18514-1 [Araneus ventricosus]|uniref:Uncharacterized protein n=1 Tax=Araneus ventricosus TaxID=182803 RepID=A0A4Y2SL05_ARAVE|nr:hypothetical protein AVEN_18514-1 [Araneus ventricosus]